MEGGGGGGGGEIAMGQNLHLTFRVTDLNIGVYVSGRLSRYKVWRERKWCVKVSTGVVIKSNLVAFKN